MSTDRRTFLQLLTTSALSAAFPASIARALSIPAYNRTGTIDDVQHIVIFTQEKRSFDHYFGKLRGVRGFNDRMAIRLPDGDSVWKQPTNANYILPFHMSTATTSATTGTLQLLVTGPHLQVFFNGSLLIDVMDSTIGGPGTVGLISGGGSAFELYSVSGS